MPISAVPMMEPMPPPVQQPMADAVQSANPMSIMAQPIGVSGPTPEDTSAGVIEQLKGIVQATEAVAGANPQVADLMDAIKKLCVQAAITSQQQAGSQQPTGPGGY